MELLDDLQRRTATWFIDRTDPRTGLVPDRSPRDPAATNPHPHSSIAATGFGLVVWAVAAERGWLSRQEAALRTVNVFRTLEGRDHHGFHYHFLNPDGARAHRSELSSVDTSLLLGGALFASGYWGGAGVEAEIRERAAAALDAVDWPFLVTESPLICMGWTPENGYIDAHWRGYNEAMLVNLLALASPSHPADVGLWDAWCSTYDRAWGDFGAQRHLSFGPSFGHQYSQLFVDFRGIRDAFGHAHDLDYAENSRRALLSQRAYAIANPGGWPGYGETLWGMTACDGPEFYAARGCGLTDHFDDGTLSPTAVAGSLPFAPDAVLPVIERLTSGSATGVPEIDGGLYGPHGFADSFHVGRRWLATDMIGIDQGPIVAMIENHRTGLVWDVLRSSAYLRRGLTAAGFTGGWLTAA